MAQKNFTLATLPDGRVSKKVLATTFQNSGAFPAHYVGPSIGYQYRFYENADIRRYVENKGGRMVVRTISRQPLPKD